MKDVGMVEVSGAVGRGKGGEGEVTVEAVSYAKKHALMISAGLYTPGTYIVRTRSQRES